MTCEVVPMPGTGALAILCHRNKHRQFCRCGRPATRLCDFAKGQGRTCDRPLCERCAVNVGPRRDYCVEHPLQPGDQAQESFDL